MFLAFRSAAGLELEAVVALASEGPLGVDALTVGPTWVSETLIDVSLTQVTSEPPLALALQLLVASASIHAILVGHAAWNEFVEQGSQLVYLLIQGPQGSLDPLGTLQVTGFTDTTAVGALVCLLFTVHFIFQTQVAVILAIKVAIGVREVYLVVFYNLITCRVQVPVLIATCIHVVIVKKQKYF